MRLDQDERTGFLRVDGEGLEAVAQMVPAFEDMLADGQELDEESQQFLTAIDEIPGLRQSVRAFSDPVYQLVIVRASREDLTMTRCWFRGEGSAVALPAGDDEFLAFGLSPVQLPSLVANLITLGARQQLHPPVQTDITELGRLFDESAEVRAGALERLGIPTDGWAWQLQLNRSGEEPDAVMLAVDSGAGLLRAVSGGTGDQLRLEPALPTDVWTDLITFLLPESLPEPGRAE